MHHAFPLRRPLGRTGLLVSPLGIGGGSGIESRDLLYAFDHGINYFFFSSNLHHFLYQRSVSALRSLCEQGSSVREQVVLATVTYINHPEKVRSVLFDQLLELGVDYIDVFHWGWVTKQDDMLSLLKEGHRLRQNSSLTRSLRSFTQTSLQQMQCINEDLVKSGLVRYVGASFHLPALARTWMRNLDVLMLRYNIAHRSIEKEVMPHLYGNRAQDPGIVAFNVGRAFMVPSELKPAEFYVPSIPDCYRFALSQPWIDVVLTGVQNQQEIDQALAMLEQGPMDEEACQRMRQHGEHIRARTSSFQ